MKIIYKILTVLACLVIAVLLANYNSGAQEQKTVELAATIQQSMAMLIDSEECNFGTIISGIPSRCENGFILSVKTNSAYGYALGVHDGVAGSNSAMVHTDLTTYIPDYSATINSPDFFNPGTDVGVGITVYSADTNKEIKWGEGSSYNDLDNKYAGIPELMQTVHTSPNYKSDFDNTGLAFIMDVSSDQKKWFIFRQYNNNGSCVG